MTCLRPLSRWQHGAPDFHLSLHPWQLRSGQKLLRVGWGRQVFMVGSGDLATPCARGQPLTVHSFPQPQTPGIPSLASPPRVGPRVITGLPSLCHTQEPFNLTAGIGKKKGPPSFLQGSLCLRAPTRLPMGLSVRLGLSGHSYVSACQCSVTGLGLAL